MVEIHFHYVEIHFHYENKLVGMIFSENNLIQQSDVVFDSQLILILAILPPGGEKKNIFNFFFKMTSRVSVSVFLKPKGFKI